MNEEKPLWEHFDDEINDQEDDINKIESQTVWHEIGHVIGFIISQKFNKQFGAISGIVLIDEKARVEHNCNLFKAKDNVPRDRDEIGNTIFYYSQKDNKRLKENLDDPLRFLEYSIFTLSGGLFNIYSINPNPTKIDFENCFLDDPDQKQEGSFISMAGNDWSKLRNLIAIKNWKENIFFNFKIELFELMKKHRLFESYREIIENVDSTFNGREIIGLDLEELINKIQVK